MSPTERHQTPGPWRAVRLLCAKLPAAILLRLLHAYQRLLSPWLGRACRFEPSCSRYAQQSVQMHGAARGMWYAVRRLSRCHPFCAGGFDPVPPPPDRGAAQLGKAPS